MNTELLKRVQKIILKEPSKLEMLVWKFGSQRCIGGFILDLTPAAVKEELGLPAEDVWGLELQTCAKILNITIDQSHKLFPLAGWPEEFRLRYHACETAAERAGVVSDYIDFFIKYEQ